VRGMEYVRIVQQYKQIAAWAFDHHKQKDNTALSALFCSTTKSPL